MINDNSAKTSTKEAKGYNYKRLILMMGIPAFFDCVGCTLMYVALNEVAASIYQMMRGIIVVITASMSVVFLSRKQYFHHWASLVAILLGVAIIGVVGIFYSGDEKEGG